MSDDVKTRFDEALADAAIAIRKLRDSGREDRALGLAVAVDLGTSAAFLFSIDRRAYEDATKIVREAIAHANREEE